MLIDIFCLPNYRICRFLFFVFAYLYFIWVWVIASKVSYITFFIVLRLLVLYYIILHITTFPKWTNSGFQASSNKDSIPIVLASTFLSLSFECLALEEQVKSSLTLIKVNGAHLPCRMCSVIAGRVLACRSLSARCRVDVHEAIVVLVLLLIFLSIIFLL